MTYYKYQPNSNVYTGVMHSPKRWASRLFYDDSPQLTSWCPIAIDNVNGEPHIDGDFPTLFEYGSLPVVTARAWSAIKPLIGEACEALLVIYSGLMPHFIIHVLQTIDALDVDLSQVRRSNVDNSIAQIYRYAFKPGMLDGVHIFKLPLRSGGGLFVDEDFRRIVQEHNLLGLHFNKLPMTDAPQNAG